MTRRWPAVLALAACLLGGEALAAQAQAPAPVTPASVTVDAPGGEVTITAERMEQPGPTVLIARGNVELTRGTTRLLADRLEVNRDTGDAVALGRVIFYDGEDRLTGERIDYNLKTGTGVVHDGQARSAPYYRIGGERMDQGGVGPHQRDHDLAAGLESDSRSDFCRDHHLALHGGLHDGHGVLLEECWFYLSVTSITLSTWVCRG